MNNTDGLLKGRAQVLDWTEKLWGSACQIVRSSNFMAYLASVSANGESSWHRHEHMNNCFVLLEGSAVVYSVSERSGSSESVLKPFSSIVVPPGVTHKFKAGNRGALLLELYWSAEVDPNDVFRVDVKPGV